MPYSICGRSLQLTYGSQVNIQGNRAFNREVKNRFEIQYSG